MSIDPAELFSIRALWTSVIQQAVIEAWEEQRSLRAPQHAKRRATAQAAFEYYLNTRDFQRVCMLAGVDHGPALVNGIMKLVLSHRRPAFLVGGRAREGEA